MSFEDVRLTKWLQNEKAAPGVLQTDVCVQATLVPPTPLCSCSINAKIEKNKQKKQQQQKHEFLKLIVVLSWCSRRGVEGRVMHTKCS